MATITDKDRSLIEKHLDKNLNEAEKSLFNQRLEDADFKQELALYQQSVDAVYRLGDDKIKAMLVETHEKMIHSVVIEEKRTPQYFPLSVVFSRRNMGLAASFLLLLSIGIWFLMPDNSNEKLFKDNFEPYKNFVYVEANRSERTKEEIQNDIKEEKPLNDLQKAFVAYDKERYEAALNLFDASETTVNFAKDSLNLYKSMCYLALNKTDKALITLKTIQADPHSTLKNETEWYEALTYLKVNNKDAAKKILIGIQHRPEHRHAEKAAELLGKL